MQKTAIRDARSVGHTELSCSGRQSYGGLAVSRSVRKWGGLLRSF